MANLQSIIITNGIGLFLIILTFVSSFRARHGRSLDNQVLTWMLIIIGVACFGEAASYLLDGKVFPGAWALNMFFNTALYLCNASFSILWCVYVDYRLYHSEKRLKSAFRLLYITTGILILVALGNVFGQYLFTISEDNVYQRTSLAYSFFVIPLLYISVSVTDVYQYKRKRAGVSFFPIWAFLAPFLLGCVIQALFYGISIAWCSTAVAVAAVYMSLQNELVYQDPLTKLYNRYYLNYVLQSSSWARNGRHSGIMIDVDDFKAINDSFGHSSGDQALCDTARIIRESIPDSSAPIRFAGDEFIVLMNTGDLGEAQAVARNIAEHAKRFVEENERPYRLSLSMGAAVYHPDEGGPDRFLEEIDRRMYEDKRVKYETGELKERRH